MWKNVRAILAFGAMGAYTVYTGVEVWFTKQVPQHFVTSAALVAGYYFTTRAAEGRGTKGGGPNQDI